MKTIEGMVTIVQESRFQLTDDCGVSHLFLLGHDSFAEPDQLEALARTQARIRVRYSEPADVIGLMAHSMATL